MPADVPRFVVDAHLGHLARRLRMLGLDAALGNEEDEPLIFGLSDDPDRILLTTRPQLAEEGLTDEAHLLQHEDLEAMTAEVVERYDLADHLQPLTRCLRDNVPLEMASADAVAEQVPEQSREAFDQFWQCPVCEQVFWRGSHYDRMMTFVERIRARAD